LDVQVVFNPKTLSGRVEKSGLIDRKAGGIPHVFPGNVQSTADVIGTNSGEKKAASRVNSDFLVNMRASRSKKPRKTIGESPISRRNIARQGRGAFKSIAGRHRSRRGIGRGITRGGMINGIGETSRVWNTGESHPRVIGFPQKSVFGRVRRGAQVKIFRVAGIGVGGAVGQEIGLRRG